MENEKKLKNLVIALAVIAVLLAAFLAYIWIDRNKMVDDLTVEKDQLTEQTVQLKNEYASLSSNNDSLNTQLVREREKVDQLIDRVKKTEATNKHKLRQYEKELGTLRSIMRGYIVQIDSLNTLNTHLRKETAAAKDEVKETKQKYNDLQNTTDEYARQVQKGSVLKGRGFNMIAITATNKETDRSSRAVKLKTCMNLVENSIATKGPRKIYLRVKGPDGILMTGASQQIFNIGQDQMIYSAIREVDYQGSELEVCIYFANNAPFVKGVYNVDVYTEEGKLGSADLLLR
jgi:myosin heavy subunit